MFTLWSGRRPAGPAVRRRRRHAGARHAARARRRSLDRRRSGGCTAPATGPSIRSPRRSRELLARCPTRSDHICYTRPGPDDVRGDDYDTAGRLSADVLGRSTSRATPTCTSADRRRSWPTSPPALVGLGIDAGAHPHRDLRTPGSLNPGVVGVAGAAPHPPAGAAGDGPAVSFARSDLTVHVGPGLRKPARARRSVRRAEPLVVPHRRLPHLRNAASWPDRSPTRRSRSTRPRRATC